MYLVHSVLCFALVFATSSEIESHFQPSRSLVDYLKVRKQDSSFAARQAMYQIFFPKQKYTGAEAQNIALLKALLAKDESSAPSLAHSLTESRRNIVLGLIGGFGWGSRDDENTPRIWEFRPESCRVEPGIVADIRREDMKKCVAFPAEWDGGLALANGISGELQSNPKSKVVLIGHSFGGSSVADVARALARKNITVDLAVLIDPVNNNASSLDFGAGRLNDLPNNVRQWAVIAASKPFPLKVTRPDAPFLEFIVRDTDHESVTRDKHTHEIISVLVDWKSDRAFDSDEFDAVKKQRHWGDSVRFVRR